MVPLPQIMLFIFMNEKNVNYKFMSRSQSVSVCAKLCVFIVHALVFGLFWSHPMVGVTVIRRKSKIILCADCFRTY